jgi:hypothetical protein
MPEGKDSPLASLKERIFSRFRQSNPIASPVLQRAEASSPPIVPIEEPKSKTALEQYQDLEPGWILEHEKKLDVYEKFYTPEQRIRILSSFLNQDYTFRFLSDPALVKEAEAYADAVWVQDLSTYSEISHNERWIKGLAIQEYLIAHNPSLNPRWKEINDKATKLLQDDITLLAPLYGDNHTHRTMSVADTVAPRLFWGDLFRAYIVADDIYSNFDFFNSAAHRLVKELAPECLETGYFFAKPMEKERMARPLYRESILHILRATNRARREIVDGSLDNLSAEDAYFHLHKIHRGDTPRDTLLADASDCPNTQELEDHASQYQRDLSLYSERAYRTEDMSWNEVRGILGIPPLLLPEFSKRMFGIIDTLIQNRDTLSPEAKISSSLFYSLLVDITHVKYDLNGRTGEDFMIWMQRRLGVQPQNMVFLSENGLRARRAENIVGGDLQSVLQRQRERIDGKTQIGLKIRQAMYQEMVRIAQNEGDPRIIEICGMDEYVSNRTKEVSQLFYRMLELGDIWLSTKHVQQSKNRLPIQTDPFMTELFTHMNELDTYLKQHGISRFAFLPEDCVQ